VLSTIINSIYIRDRSTAGEDHKK